MMTPYLVSVTASAIGTSMIPVTVSFALLDQAGSIEQMGSALAVEALVFALLTLPGGAVADRVGGARVMFASEAVRALTQALLALAVGLHQARASTFIASMAVIGASNAFFVPAAACLIPQLSGRNRLQRTNAIIGICMALSNVIGPAVSGMLIAARGSEAALHAILCCFGASAVASGIIMHRWKALAHRPASSFGKDIVAGWREFRRHRWLGLLVMQCAFLNVAAVAPMMIIGSIQFHAMPGGAAMWGRVLASAGVGGLGGGILLSLYRPKRDLVVVECTMLAITVPLVTLAVDTYMPALYLGGFIFGVTLAVLSVSLQTAVQESVPVLLLARVSSINQLLILGSLPIAYAFVSALAATMPSSHILWLSSILVVLSCIGMLLSSSIRQHEPRLQSERVLQREPAVGGMNIQGEELECNECRYGDHQG